MAISLRNDRIFRGIKIENHTVVATYPLGSNIGKLRRPIENKELNWPSTEIKYLGAIIPVNNLKSEKNLFTLNFNEFLPKVEALLNIWSSRLSRGFSLLGKITVIKCFLLPMVVFKILVLPVFPQKILQKSLHGYFISLFGVQTGKELVDKSCVTALSMVEQKWLTLKNAFSV